jgi:RNA polymerase sigma factor (sigma-70 family)
MEGRALPIILSMKPTARSDQFSEEFIPTRHSLLGRLKSWEDQRSWQDFFDTYWRLIYRVARKAGLDENAAQDVVQETVLAVAKAMPGFEYQPERCSFKGWLMHLTRCRIADQFRKRGRQVPITSGGNEESARTPLLERVADPAALPELHNWDAEWEQNLLDAAMDAVKARINPKHFQMFYCTAVKQMPAPEVADLLNVKVAQVYLAKNRVTALVKKEVERLEAKWQ